MPAITTMRTFFHPEQDLREPVAEMHSGCLESYRQHGRRVVSVLATISALEHPADVGFASMRAVHSAPTSTLKTSIRNGFTPGVNAMRCPISGRCDRCA